MKTKATDPKNEVKALTVRLAPITRALVIAPANAAEVVAAVGQRNGLKALAKDLKAKKDGIVKPLNEAMKRVRELFKPVEERIADAIAQVTAGLEAYNRRADDELEEHRERLEAKVESGRISEARAAEVMDRTTTRLGADVIPVRQVRVVTVVDEALVPDKYWVLDMTAIRRDALDGVAILGVKVETQDQIFAT